MAEVRKAARQATTLNAMFWRDHKSDRLKSLETSRAEMREFKSRIEPTDPLRPRGARMENEVHILHDQLDLAFGLAAGASPADARSRGAAFAAMAREVVLDEVIYPYNRLFGQYKKPEELWGLAAKARERFGATLAASDGIRDGQTGAVRLVFEDYVRAIEELREWGLQAEPGRLARAVDPAPARAASPSSTTRSRSSTPSCPARRGRRSSAATCVFYWNGQQWQLTLHRSILAARDYHVLWLHDFDGVDHGGDADGDQLLHHGRGLPEGAHRARARVRHDRQASRLHDPGGPQLLGSEQGPRCTPTCCRTRCAPGRRCRSRRSSRTGKMQEGVERALAELRGAVAGSKRLQEEASRRGQDWLRKYVSVHLNVMNPADFSYRTSRLIDYLPIAPDTIVRDHRKIIFFDVTELDPGKGAAIYGGVGVGEQYASATWEDRSTRLAGPAALSVKDAARRYLKANGVQRRGDPAPAAAACQARRLRRAREAARGATAGPPRRWRCTTTAASRRRTRASRRPCSTR